MSKIKRNEKCWCNSGKKYKNCHYSSNQIVDFEEKKILNFSDIKKNLKLFDSEIKTLPKSYDEFLSSQKLLFVIPTDKIPNEIKSDVESLIDKYPPKLGQCFYYSHFISRQIEGVKQVFGFMTLNKDRNFYGIPESVYDEWVDDELSPTIVDSKGITWGLHAWNEYNGVHFDCMKSEIYEKMYDYKFIKYKIHKIKDYNQCSIDSQKYLKQNYFELSGSLYNMN